MGNRLNPPADTVNKMVYNAADQLTLWPGMHSYSYYKDGSLKDVRNPAGTQVLRSYTYTPDGLLSSASYSGRTSTFTWDGDKNRVGMTMNGDYAFVYDTTAGIPAVVEEAKDGGVPIYYFREPGGELIARMQGTDWHFYHFDALGSTRLLTDGIGNVTDKYAYEAWGEVLTHDKSTTNSVNHPYQYVGQMGYYTHYQDLGFASLQLGVRFYDQENGIFGQTDPAGNSVANLYTYVNNRPTELIDPTGLVVQYKGCTEKQKKQMDLHLKDIAKNRIKCLTGGKSFRDCILRRTGDIVIECLANCNPGDCGGTVVGPRKTIRLCPDAFNKSKCGCLGSTMLHEIAHSCNRSMDPSETPEGFQCEWDCYKKKGSNPCPD